MMPYTIHSIIRNLHHLHLLHRLRLLSQDGQLLLLLFWIFVVVGGGAFIGYKFLAKKKSQLQENVEKTSFLGAGEPNKNLLINEQEST